MCKENRRHSLRLTPAVKEIKAPFTIHETIPKWRQAENDTEDENLSINNDDSYDDLLARHHRHMLEEQKDRKLYERYVRGQRSLRRLQCRRTHTAHLNEATRNRLLRELERERCYAIRDKICAYLANHTIVFQHGCNIESKEPINWSRLEEEIPHNRNIGTIHQLDVMIGNLKKVIRNSKSSISKPRLSVRERQKQRLASKTLSTSIKSDVSQTNEIDPSLVISNSTLNIPSQLPIVSFSPRVPIVRFIDDQYNKIPISNSQHLTCIQNVLSHNEQSNNNSNNRLVTNEMSTSISIRKLVLRPKSTHVNLSDSSPTKKRPLEKENYSVVTNSSNNNTHSNSILKNTSSPMVSIKYTTSHSSSRSYPNTRKHPMINNSLTTRRQTRLSGDYRNCDIPFWTVQTILQYASELEDFDFIYYTGDLPPHNVWNQSRADQLYAIKTINQLLATTFPNKTFYPAVGNHEAAPCNMFPTPMVRSDNISWLYEALADSWFTLGLPSDTRDTITRGAFYTTIVRPGLRLISLNMNYCSSENYWLFINATDPLGQLQWLIQWLQYAEDHDEKVHIIGHHPPRSCLAAFSWNFHKIINRYENTIAGQFYGHTHNDEFIVFYDEIEKQRPVSMAYVTPSLTTQSFLNPGYRVYTMDGAYPDSSYWVLDHRTVIMNLTASNMYNRSILINEYEARNAYQMENLFPADWDNLIQRMKNDIDGPLMSLAYTYYTKSYATGAKCNHDCRKGLLCNFMTGRSDDPHACDSIPTYR
ncbi:unnamed protein product [Rotaria sp. Silwood2]|nr:unnamed protein product [Rotaria sp. Silwood2]